LLLIFLLSPYFVTYPRSLHDALPISVARPVPRDHAGGRDDGRATVALPQPGAGERGVSDMAEPSNDVLLDVRDLAVHFPIKRGLVLDRTVGYVYAVDGVSLQIRRGEIYGLVGESGCGKSTLGRAILRLVDLTAGIVEFDGVDVAQLSGERLRTMRRRFQMVFQDPMSSLDPRQSVESLLREGINAHGLSRGPEADAAWLRELVESVGLSASALRRYSHEFSGGQRQRIGIARAL